ncbi:MaoC family dehydratase N-terminal domain-containing protein [Burkholderiaceae bacterium FT117]|uniref:FAS1-like dehydratase domain-containing protein n=1 Tax=Zeimonas sediminis TaxID=2944268 RepID=UPI002343147A|nr:MaoC family dehydratase N-terminal domain-containing protein [Zeimonas sediminis]MCM5570400.1 MaoC family dehydratase N-terminal domain-containing protein [Zeimonas sediminis]
MDAAVLSHPAPGQALPALVKGPYASSHIVRWCAAQQNWDKIHYDLDYAQRHAGLPERVVNGALKQHLLVQCLERAFGPAFWPWRLAFRFAGPDFLGEALSVGGSVRSVERRAGLEMVLVDVAITNLGQQRDTTLGSAVLVRRAPGDATEAFVVPEALGDLALDESIEEPVGPVPPQLAVAIGEAPQRRVSAYPLDLSRLRLFADAIGDLRAEYFDPEAGRASAHGTVVAPPLFPIHGLEAMPGSLPLSTDPAAMGREGVNEIGRNLAARLGIALPGAVNGGNDVEIASLLRVGETVSATSAIVGASVKSGSRGAAMLIVRTLNTYRTTGGRLLLKEKQTSICRNFGAAASDDRLPAQG